MLCIINDITDPYINIASEEYLLKNFSEDIFMLYANQPSIIIGKHQNAFAEINHTFVHENNIPVIRRLSGGGTVFHDIGNLNFCFIRNGQEGNLIDFKKFTQPILDVLQNLGIPAERSGRNDLIIQGLKFSGNAEHVFKNRVLHHGTLLFSSQLHNLGDALKVNHELYQDRAVKSVRSKVTNIQDHLTSSITLEDLKGLIMEHVISENSGVKHYKLTETDQIQIHHLVKEKYSKWEWNYGYSPKFIYKTQGVQGKLFIEVKFEIEKGIIKQADIKVNKEVISELSLILQGVRYSEEEILSKLQYSNTLNPTDFVKVFF